MKVTDIKTEVGNRMLATLVKKQGWRVQSEYDKSAFDKGIDFDSYIVEKNGQEMHFEWTNWLEWEVSGEQSVLNELSKKYGFKLQK